MSNDTNKLKKRQEIRKYLVFAGMFLLFIGCMWWIFAPSEKDRQEKEKNAGFNTELPDPRGAGIEADKITAYEQADMRRRQEEKMRTLEDFSAMADGNRKEPVTEPVIELSAHMDYPDNGTSNRNGGSYRRSGTFTSSASAYNDINATLGSFYETPKEDPEKEALKAELEQLKQAAAMPQPAQMTYEEQVALLEKSYELAAKYTPGKDGAGSESREEAAAVSNGRKAKAVPVGQVSAPVVSSLPQPVSDSMLFARLEHYGNAGFHTAVGGSRQRPYQEHYPRLCTWRPDRHQRAGRETEASGTDACRQVHPSTQFYCDRRGAHSGRTARYRNHPSGAWRSHHTGGTYRV